MMGHLLRRWLLFAGVLAITLTYFGLLWLVTLSVLHVTGSVVAACLVAGGLATLLITYCVVTPGSLRADGINTQRRQVEPNRSDRH